MTPDAAWNAAYNQLQARLDANTFSTWLRGAQFAGYEAGIYHIEVSTPYACDMLQKRLYRDVRGVLSQIAGESCEIQFSVSGEANGTAPAADAPLPDALPDTQVEVADEDDQPERQPDEWHFFAKVPNHIVDNLDPGPGWLLVAIIRHLHYKTNILIRNLDQLATLSGMGRNTVKRHIKVLVDAGHLHVKSGTGRGSANEYRLIGPLAVAVCGVKIANETALQIKLEAAQQPSPTPPDQPESTEDDANKAAQFGPTSNESPSEDELKQPNLGLQNNNPAQFGPTSDDKAAQNGPPIQTFSFSSDGLNDTDDKPNKIIHSNSGDDLEETQIPTTPPTPTYPALAAWVQEWGEVTTAQNLRLKALSAQYDPAVIQAAMRATVKAYRENIVRYHSRLDYLEAACKQRSGDTLAALAVAAG